MAASVVYQGAWQGQTYQGAWQNAVVSAPGATMAAWYYRVLLAGGPLCFLVVILMLGGRI